jgi:GT2 family glycosyltransferase
LKSLEKLSYVNYEILIVDNGSIDDSVTSFKKLYPDIEIIENGKNLGYAEGNNVGIRRAIDKKAEYVLLLNNDVIVDSIFLTELVCIAENDSKVGFVGPKVYYYNFNGRKNIINFAGGKINFFLGKPYHIGFNKEDHGQYDNLKPLIMRKVPVYWQKQML